MEKYLHLMKSIFLLDKVKASSEYASKVKTARNLLWFAVLQDLEDVRLLSPILAKCSQSKFSVAELSSEDTFRTKPMPAGFQYRATTKYSYCFRMTSPSGSMMIMMLAVICILESPWDTTMKSPICMFFSLVLFLG